MCEGSVEYDPADFMARADFIDKLARDGAIGDDEAAEEMRLLLFGELDQPSYWKEGG